MLNYIWAGLIIFSLVFALVGDVSDLSQDRFRNGEPLAVRLEFPEGQSPQERRTPVRVRVSRTTFADHYGHTLPSDLVLEGALVRSAEGNEIRFGRDAPLPEPLATIRTVTGGQANELRAVVARSTLSADSSVLASVLLPPVRFTKMTAIAQAAIDFADTAVSLVIGLIGALVLWMGLLRIAEASGMLHGIIRLTQPLFRRLFPEIPEDHPAIGMIVLNLSANMLGLGNAATPLGLKAMEELQELNPSEDTATNSMVMLLALNTASVQIVPPVLLVAIMGLQINQLFFSILLVTLFSAIVAVTVTRLFGKMKRYRETDPLLGTGPQKSDS